MRIWPLLLPTTAANVCSNAQIELIFTFSSPSPRISTQAYEPIVILTCIFLESKTRNVPSLLPERKNWSATFYRQVTASVCYEISVRRIPLGLGIFSGRRREREYVPSRGMGLILNISNLHSTSPTIRSDSANLILSITASPLSLLRFVSNFSNEESIYKIVYWLCPQKTKRALSFSDQCSKDRYFPFLSS